MKQPPGRDYNAWEQLNQDFLAGPRGDDLELDRVRALPGGARALSGAGGCPCRAASGRSVPTGGTFCVMLSAAPAPEKEAAWRFLRFLLEPARQRLGERNRLPAGDRGAVRAPGGPRLLRAHPNDRVALDQLSVAEPWPWSTQLFRIQREVVQPRLEARCWKAAMPSACWRTPARSQRRASCEAEPPAQPFWMLLPSLAFLGVFFVFPLGC